MSRPALRQMCATLFAAWWIAACGGTAMTPLPAGYPLNACPTVGDGAVIPKEGSHLVAPGEIVFDWTLRTNESPPALECGAQSVQGAKTTIRRSELTNDPKINWVATLHRAVPLVAPERAAPRLQLFKIDAAGPALIDTHPLDIAEQYAAFGSVLPGAPVGRYRMVIVSQAGEVLAEGTFEVVG